MRHSPFHRNHIENILEPSRKPKKGRLSVDTPSSPSAKTPLDSRKHKRRSSNLCQDKREGNHSKSRPLLCSTAKNSVAATRPSSPRKGPHNNNSLPPASALIKNYKFYYQIGFGAFGRVWKVAERESGREWALKEISKSKVMEKSNVSSVLNERVILSRLTHPFIVNVHAAFQDEANLFLAIDYLRGADLRYHICYKEHFSQKEIRFIAGCLINALDYVHSNNVIHRDIKPENILFQEGGYVRLTDFGIAKLAAEENNPARAQASGTPVYMAPEILFRRDFSFESDYYSLGVVLFELALGRRPYSGKSRSEIREQLLDKEICLSEGELSRPLSPELMALINRLLKKNPTERLGRGGAGEVKAHSFFKGFKWASLKGKELKPPFIPNVVCETQNYLNEIALFNEMNQQDKQNCPLPPSAQTAFDSYFFLRESGQPDKKKALLKKNRRGSQPKINI